MAVGSDAQLPGGYNIDSQSREVIYRAIDVQSRRVVRQTPQEAALKLKAYRSAINEPGEGDRKGFEKTA